VSAVLVPIVCALVAGVLCGFGPRLIARLPEPEPDPEPEAEPEAERPASPMAGADVPPKVPYVELAARPGLGLKLSVVGAASGLLVGLQLGDQAIVGAWLFLAVLGTVLGYIDAQTRLIPFRIIAPSYAVMVALVGIAAVVDQDTGHLLRAGIGWLAYGGFFFLLWFVYPRGLGYGDVRLAGVLGIALGYLGLGEVFVGMYAGLLLGGVIGALLSVVKIVDRKRYPFGPFMVAGAYVGLVWGGAFADWYLGR
jgi:leader peptidase (prepilin peptidase)/N-methyltransferase